MRVFPFSLLDTRSIVHTDLLACFTEGSILPPKTTCTPGARQVADSPTLGAGHASTLTHSQSGYYK